MSIMKEELSAFAFEEVLKLLDKNPLANIPKLLDVADKIPTSAEYKKSIRIVKEKIKDPNSNWMKYIENVLTGLHPNVRKTFLTNFLIRSSLIGRPKVLNKAKEYGCSIPWTILMDPTSACNLKCVGCWAGEYSKRDSLSIEELNNIIEQGKELGMRMFMYSGGEPLLRKHDIIKLAEKHQDCAFLAFTNGTLIDEEFAQEVVRVGNIVFAISIEGFEDATDMRRGQGTYDQVIKAMDILRKAGAGFGYSCCYHSRNTDTIASDEFVDYMIEKGCLFAWYFTYVPVGKNSVAELLTTPQQRKYMYKRIREIRATKPFFALDFWNDGEYVQGCIAGGRNYFHINAHGDCEPCAFIHYSNVNIRDVTLLEALKSPLFRQYQSHQPFNHNHLRPCPLMDNPDKLKAMVHNAAAYSTQPIDKEPVDELTDKLQHVSRAWGKVADKLWNERTIDSAQNNQHPN